MRPEADGSTISLAETGYDFRRGGGPIRHFQVLGERATGTNFVRRILDNNLMIDHSQALGWKHGFPHMVAIPRDLLVVCVVRDARDWALSMHRRPWHASPELQALPFSAFLRHEWRSIVDRRGHFSPLLPGLDVVGTPLQLDRHPITGRVFPNLFALRRAKLAALAGMENRTPNLAFVRYEWFAEQPEEAVSLVSSRFEIQRAKHQFRGVHRRLGSRFRRNAAEIPPTPDAFPREDLPFLRSELDLKLEARLGYRYA